MNDGSPGLEVGFAIETGGSFDELMQLQRVMDSTEAKVVADAAQIERATGNMVNLAGAKAQVETFGNAHSRAMADLTRDTARAERAAENMVRQIDRQIQTFGKSSAEIREMRAEMRAAAADQLGLTEVAGRLRAASAEMSLLQSRTTGIGTTGKLAGHHMQNLAFQFQDVGVQMFAAAGSSEPLKMAFMALIQQGSQIHGIMGQAGIGIRGVGAAFLDMSKSILVATATNPYLLAGAAAIGLFAGAVKLLQNAANDSVDMKQYAASLGLTAKEIRNLDNVTVTFGDTAKAVFQVAGRAIWDGIGPGVTKVWELLNQFWSGTLSGVKTVVNFLISGFVGAYNAITKTWQSFPAAIGDAFYSGVNLAIDAINGLLSAAIDGLNWFGAQANKILPEAMQIPELSAPQISRLKNQYAGVLAGVGKVAEEELGKVRGRDWMGDMGRAVAKPIVDQTILNAQNRTRAEAEKKGYLDAEKGKAASNKHAERLAREAEAVAAQIRNLYALADAYKVSGAAALIAEARVKAESDAIKKRGDIEAMVSEQVALAIAQRVSDAAKGTAALRDQASIQEDVNRRVAEGNVAAERAAELVKDQLADLPLLAAAQAAQQRELQEEAMKAMTALADQQAVREQMRKAEEGQRFNSAIATGQDRIAELREELRLVRATTAERGIALATLKATREAERQFSDPAQREQYIAQQREIATLTDQIAADTLNMNEALTFAADRWDLIANNLQAAGHGMANAFGDIGGAIGGLAAIYADFHAVRARLDAEHQQKLTEYRGNEAAIAREQQLFALRTATLQVGAFGDMTAAAKGFFKEKSAGYRALMAAEKVFRAFEFAMSVRAMVQDIAETVSSVANSGARATAAGAEGIASQSKLPFPFNIAAMAATAAALVAAGISILGSPGGGKNSQPQSNNGTGTVLGDSAAQSDSIKNAINALKEVDTVMLSYSRQMASSLQSIESQIGGFASLLVRNADSLNASGGITEGFKTNMIGSVLSKIPLIGGILGGLFGTKTTVMASGLYGGAQSMGSILNGGFDASYYSDVQKKKKLFGFTTSNKTSTSFSGADPILENQFTLILRSFNDAIVAAAGPLGASTSEIQQRLNGFVVNIGKIDLKGLTGEQIEEKLNAVFGAAADNMARAAFPLIDQFQKVGEGAFETLVRVASTLEAVGASLDMVGQGAQGMSIAAKMGLADQFESVGALTSAVDSYFQSFFTKEEQAAARTAQMASVFQSLGLSMPTTLAGFRQLVEAQNLNTSAGQATYATLLKLAPAFADLQAAMEGAKSAADIASERADLQRQLLELQGDTAALRALQLAKLDASNRDLQKEIWALQDAQAAAKAADELRKAWQSVGDSIMDEVRRIRGMTDASGGTSFASLLGQFNTANAAARGGDIDAAKSLPQLSQALLAAAADAATSRQELDRVRAQIAAALEATHGLVTSLAGNPAPATTAELLNAGAASQPGTAAVNDNSPASLAAKIEELTAEVGRLRSDNNSGHAATAANTGAMKRTLDNVTADSSGTAVTVAVA